MTAQLMRNVSTTLQKSLQRWERLCENAGSRMQGTLCWCGAVIPLHSPWLPSLPALLPFRTPPPASAVTPAQPTVPRVPRLGAAPLLTHT
jgi:hypothetical protein